MGVAANAKNDFGISGWFLSGAYIGHGDVNASLTCVKPVK